MEQAGCLYAIIGKRTTHCGRVQRGLRDLARLEGEPARHRHGQRRRLAAGRSFADHVPGRDRPVGVDGARHRGVGRVVRELVRHRRRADHDPLARDQAARDRGQPGVPLLLGPRLEFVVRRTCSGRTSRPRTGRGRSSARSAAPRTRTRRPGRSATVPMTPWAGQTVRIVFAGAGPGLGLDRRGGRGRRPDHATVESAAQSEAAAGWHGTWCRYSPWPRPRACRRARPRGGARSRGPIPNRPSPRPSRIDRRRGGARPDRCPSPISATRSTSRSPVTSPRITTVPPAGVCRIAFATRLASTSRSRTGSTSRIGRSSPTSAVTVTPAVPAAPSNDRTTSAISTSGSVGSRCSVSVPASDSATVRRSSMSRSMTRVSSRIARQVRPRRSGGRHRSSPRGCPRSRSAASAARGSRRRAASDAAAHRPRAARPSCRSRARAGGPGASRLRGRRHGPSSRRPRPDGSRRRACRASRHSAAGLGPGR